MKRKFMIKERGRCHAGLVVSCALVLGGTALAQGPPTWQAPVGNLNLEKKMLVGTCFSNFDNNNQSSNAEGFVLAAFDTRDPKGMAGAADGDMWVTESLNGNVSHLGQVYRYHHDHWRAERLGEIFGVAVSESNTPDIFVSTSSTYTDSGISVWDQTLAPNQMLTGAGSPNGRVYRIDGVTGDAVDVVSLNTGGAAGQGPVAELGNLCWHQSGDGKSWIYVSNLDDGLIYQLDANNLQSPNLTFDHGVLGRPNEGLAVKNDNPAVEYTDYGRRIWAVQVRDSDSRLYYGVWNSGGDFGMADWDGQNEIWSVALDASDGSFQSGTARREIVLPMYGANSQSIPPASIDFGNDEVTILIAERGRANAGLHSGRLLEYTETGGTWPLISEKKYKVGKSANDTNSAGGVSQDCEGNIWVSGNFHTNNGAQGHHRIYGSSRIPAGVDYGANPSDVDGTTSLWLDYNVDSTDGNKSFVGALAMYDPCACAEIIDTEIHFDDEGNSFATAELGITNTSATGATWVSIIPGIGLDAVCIDGLTDARGHARVELGAELTMGQEFLLDGITLKGAEPGEEVCFRVILFDANNQTCCSDEICVTMPECFDWKMLGEPRVIAVSDSGASTVELCLSVTNLVEYDFYEYQILENFGAVIEPFAPFSLGEIQELKVTLPDVPTGGQYSFTLVMHSENYEKCCSRTVTVDIPSGTEPSDNCWDMTLTDRVCCDEGKPALAGLSFVNSESTEVDLYAIIHTDSISPDCKPLPLERVKFPGRDIEGDLIKFPITAGDQVDQVIEIACEGLDFTDVDCYMFCITVTDGKTDIKRTECLRIEPCRTNENPIVVGSVGVVNVGIGVDFDFSFDLTNGSDEEVTFDWGLNSPIDGFKFDTAFDVGQNVTLGVGEVLNVNLGGQLTEGTVDNSPWLTKVFSAFQVTAQIGDAEFEEVIGEIPVIVRPQTNGSGESVCIDSFETMSSPVADLVKVTVSVNSPNSVITIQKMGTGEELWTDVPFGITTDKPAQFDAYLLNVGTFELFLSRNGESAGVYRVICTPGVPSGGGAGGATATPVPPGPPSQ